MKANAKLDIIKEALLIEHKGRALYESAANTTDKPELKELFQVLVKEEDGHIELLNRQFGLIKRGEAMKMTADIPSTGRSGEEILTSKVIRNISGAGYEAAVISAALEFEKNAVAYYQDQAASAQAENEKKLFEWLTRWEKTHLKMLADIDAELKQKIWYDNQFWPGD